MRESKAFQFIKIEIVTFKDFINRSRKLPTMKNFQYVIQYIKRIDTLSWIATFRFMSIKDAFISYDALVSDYNIVIRANQFHFISLISYFYLIIKPSNHSEIECNWIKYKSDIRRVIWCCVNRSKVKCIKSCFIIKWILQFLIWLLYDP